MYAPRAAMVVTCAVALAGCNVDGKPSLNAAQPRGASVAFDSIDGLPPGQFKTLVRNLNEEAESRHLAVISREHMAAFRVRGYFAATVSDPPAAKHAATKRSNPKRAAAKQKSKATTTISWVWDVFDGEERRVLRIDGEETVAGDRREAWSAADDAMLKRIARSSMERLAAFLTSPAVAPNAPAAAPPAQVALGGPRDPSPEAAGIFRILRPQADPAAAAPGPEASAAEVPLPRSRPAGPAALSARGALTLASAGTD